MKKIVILSVLLAWVAVFGLLWSNLNPKSDLKNPQATSDAVHYWQINNQVN